ncbi:tetratricopeptide repeat protein [Streptomyces sp. NPDC021093]|uniref:tetratricopeptide repeat protein n=1 Tax=Streptomyces sp. NPDC021093 TaxID=3365112 RepID=UPI0037B455F2
MKRPEGPAHFQQDHFQRHIHVANGFAYGVIGADIHVFGDGVPLYLLTNWRGATPADPAWLRELPSRMLNSRHAVVDFTGRTAELDQLHTWRRERPKLAARWLYGPGGQGKSRLAARFADQAAADGWKVVNATHGPGTVLPPPGSQDLRPDGSEGLLLIVDYADRWPLSHLTWLFSNNLFHTPGLPTRLLLLGRTDGTWPALRAALANHQAGTSQQQLDPLPDGTEQRRTMFDAARDSFAALYGVRDPGLIAPPGPLGPADFGLTLAVHMAALVAVDASVSECRPPQGMAGLTVYLLDREHLHWALLFGDGTHELDPAERAFRTPPAVMNQAVFTAALTGPVSPPTATVLLDRIRLPLPADGVLADHSTCYPPAATALATALEPLYPDRLAEDFLALTLPGHRADYPAQSWAPATATALLARRPGGAAPAHTPRAVTFLAASADRWPHLGADHLYPLLRDDPRLALDAGSAALVALAANPTVDMELLEAIAARFPQGRDVDLDAGMLAVLTRLAPARLARAEHPADRARVHDALAFRRHNAGLHEESLTSARTALAIWRRLAAEDPLTYTPEVAGTLTGLGVALSELGLRGEALEATEEDVATRRGLLASGRADHERALARSLVNLSALLSESARPQEALAVAREAVDLCQHLAHGDPPTPPMEITGAWNILAVCLAQTGDISAVLEPARALVALFRTLAETEPASYLPQLAGYLANLADWSSKAGQGRPAAAAARESVGIRRRLARKLPTAFTPEVAEALNTLALCLLQAGDPEAALDAATEAVETGRRLTAEAPAVHSPALARYLNTFAIGVSETRGDLAALTPLQEAVDLYRTLAAGQPGVFRPDLAGALVTLSGLLGQLRGRGPECVAAARESVDICRPLSATDPAELPKLASALINLSNGLAATEERDEALTVAREAVDLYWQLAGAEPAHQPELAIALIGLGKRSSDSLEHAESLRVTREAVHVCRALYHREGHEPGPENVYAPNFAMALWSFAEARVAAGEDLEQAHASVTEALSMYRGLVLARPNLFIHHLRAAHGTLAEVLDGLGRSRAYEG